MNSLNPVSKLLVGGGIVMIVVGLFWQFGSGFLPLGRLPGDIAVERENFKFYFPLATSILLSVALSAILYVIRLFGRP